MSEFKCSELELDYAVQQDKCKSITVGVSSDIYPIFWIGEKTYPTHYGWGRLVRVRFGDGSESYYIKRSTMMAGDFPHPMSIDDMYAREVIFIGGVKPTIMRVKYLLWIIKDEAKALKRAIPPSLQHHNALLPPALLVPNGIGYKSYAVLGEWVKVNWKQVENDELEVYDPPYLYWVTIENGEVKDVRKIELEEG